MGDETAQEAYATGRPAPAFERHIQTAFSFVLTALVGWVGFSLQAALIDIATLQAHLKAIEDRITLAASDRYYGSDAERDFKLRDMSLHDHERRILILEEYARKKDTD
jgi:hypothetical protein